MMQIDEEKYLKLLVTKEEDADYNLREAHKKYIQAQQIKAATTRERIAYENRHNN